MFLHNINNTGHVFLRLLVTYLKKHECGKFKRKSKWDNLKSYPEYVEWRNSDTGLMMESKETIQYGDKI